MVQILTSLSTKPPMKTSLFIALILFFVTDLSYADEPILVTIVTNEYQPGEFSYSFDGSFATAGSGALSPYLNNDLGFFPAANNSVMITLGSWRSPLCQVNFNLQTHQFVWVDNKPYIDPFTHKTYQCRAQYFDKYQHAFIYVVDVSG